MSPAADPAGSADPADSARTVAPGASADPADPAHAADPAGPADLVLRRGSVLTLDAGFSVAEAVARHAATLPADGWVVGNGWDVGYLAECQADAARLPARQDLDAVVADRPVLLYEFSGHTAWLNSRALELAGIDRDTVNAARQDFAEGWKGRLEPGMAADVCVLDGDLLTADPRDIPDMSVAMTVFDGEIVHGEIVHSELGRGEIVRGEAVRGENRTKD